MKIKFINLFFSLLFVLTSQGQTKNKDNLNVMQYFMKEVMLSEDAKQRIILIPLASKDIKFFISTDNNREIRYWSVLIK
jgi:hypothetical protein